MGGRETFPPLCMGAIMNTKEIEVLERLMDGGYKDLPSYCADWRAASGHSQTDVGEKCGLTKGTISRFERGQIKSTVAIYGYAACGMPIPKDLVIKYLAP